MVTQHKDEMSFKLLLAKTNKLIMNIVFDGKQMLFSFFPTPRNKMTKSSPCLIMRWKAFLKKFSLQEANDITRILNTLSLNA